MKISGSSMAVTGGAGFIGYHLIHALIGLGCKKVVVIDDLSTGRLDDFGAFGDKVEFIKHSLGYDSVNDTAAALRGVKGVFHLAARKLHSSKDRPEEVITANILGTSRVLEAAALAGLQKVIFASSLYAYGRMGGPPMSEDLVPLPSTVYGVSKLAGEGLLAHFGAETKIAYDTLRYFFVYGPRQYVGLGYKSVIVSNFERLMSGERPLVCGDGEQSLDYVFVADVVKATIMMMESEGSGRIFNVSSGEGISINHLTKLMCEIAEVAYDPVFLAPDWTAGSKRIGSNEKIRKALNWNLTVPIREGLQRTYEWMQSRKSNCK